MNHQTTIAAAAIPSAPQDASQLPQVQENRSVHLALDAPAMDQMMRLADLMATARCTIPDEFRGKPGDCLAIVMQAVQWRMNPFSLAQKTFFVSGKIGYEAQLVNAVITSMAPTQDRLHYDWYGPWEKILGKFVERESKTGKDKHGHPSKYKVPGWTQADEVGLGVKVWATLKGEAAPRELSLLMSQAITRNSTLWAEDPRQQLAYLASKRWARLYCPDVLLGVYTPDELETIVEREVEGEVVEYQTGTERLKAAATATGKAAAAAWNAARAAAQDTGPALADVLAKIAAMVTKDERKAALDLAKQLTNPADSESAATAYNGRLEWLKANPPAKATEPASGPISTAGEQNSGPATIDNETGEVSGQENARPVMTYAQVADALNKAANRDSFDVACDLIQYVADLQQREELGGIVKKRLEEFKAQ